MSNELIEQINENVIKGRRHKEDEDFEGGSVGEPGVEELVEEALKGGVKPKEIIGCINEAMEVVGKKYETGEFFIPDMMASAEAVSAGMDVLEPYLSSTGESMDKFVIATVEGDLHDIGKNIVALLLKGAGFNVIDLGTNVPADKIVETVRAEDAKLVGLSALLTTTMRRMGEVVEKLRAEGIDAKVLVGGAAVSVSYAAEIGAIYCKDAFGALEAVKND
ncbi:MAG: cobalamin B12-binding domain-containing protein [Methanophagales archaeon]|nr:cobalamin B12-binding domain-containing protein [Methanophagales archaeon]